MTRRHRIVLAILLLAAVPAMAGARTRLAEALRAGNGEAALSILREEPVSAAFGGRLCEAKALQLSGREDEAVAIYREIAGEEGELRQVALNAIRRLAKKLDRKGLEEEATERLLAVMPKHPDRWRLQARLLDLYLNDLTASGEVQVAAARKAEAILKRRPRGRRNRRRFAFARFRLLLSKRDAVGRAEVERRYRSLIEGADSDEEALLSTRLVEAFEKRRGVTPTRRSLHRRGMVYYKAREWREALDRLSRSAGISSQSPERFAPGSLPKARGRDAISRAQDLYVIGRIYYRMGRYVQAIGAYRAASSLSKTIDLSSHYQRAVCLARLGRNDEALVLLSTIVDKDPHSSLASSALRRMIATRRAERRLDAAQELIAKARKLSLSKRMVDWWEVPIAVETDPARGRRLLEGLARRGGEEGWLASLQLAELLRKGGDSSRSDSAERVLAADPAGFYGTLAEEMLAGRQAEPDAAGEELLHSARSLLGGKVSGKARTIGLAIDRLHRLYAENGGLFGRAGLPLLRQAYGQSDRYRKVLQFPRIQGTTGDRGVAATDPLPIRLLASGLVDEAVAALGSGRTKLDRWQRSALLLQAKRYRKGLYLAEVGWKRLPRQVVPDLVDPCYFRALYPLPQVIVDAARRNGISPWLAAAIAREESRFDPKARSPAGARGIMQLVADTATAISGEEVAPEDLYDEARSADLGTRYLSSMMKRFDGCLPCVIAAYNAGPEAVEGFIAHAGQGTLALLAEIPYPETRKYVAKVLLSYFRYRNLYPEPAEGGGPAFSCLFRPR